MTPESRCEARPVIQIPGFSCHGTSLPIYDGSDQRIGNDSDDTPQTIYMVL